MVHRHLVENVVWAITCGLALLLTMLPRWAPTSLEGGFGASLLVLVVGSVPWVLLQRR